MDILVVENHVLLREGLARLLDSQLGLSVVGEVGIDEKTVEKVLPLKPDAVLITVDDPEGEEISVIKAILSHQPEIKVIVLYGEASDNLLFALIRSGVKGFIPKNTPVSKIVAALRAVERGEVALPRHLTSKIIDEFVRLEKISVQRIGSSTLTARESEILRLLGTGAGNRQIAERLVIAENTVRVHVHNILEKLGFKNRQEAGEFARRQGLNDFLKDTPPNLDDS